MGASAAYRDVDPTNAQPPRDARAGRAYIAVVGIDRYRAWRRLYNAVGDASGALRLFTGLGFQLIGPPLYDDHATGDALRRLVSDDLSGLGRNDSLILFYAGHGHTVTRTYDGAIVRDGYLIPCDGDLPGGRTATWLRLDSWLTEIARIPAKHILVVIDACHSGLALGPVLQWRSRGVEHARREPLEQLRARRSRRIVTSALDDQLAMDGGPVPGHSLFTGCLIEAMTGGLVASTGHHIVTGSEIGHYVQRRVSEYPGSVQTPDFGALELDDRGELLVQLQTAEPDAAHTAVDVPIEAITAADESDASNAARSPVSAFAPLAARTAHRRYPWVGSGVAMAMIVGAAVWWATLSDSPGQAVISPPSGPADASAVVIPPDAALDVANLDAASPNAQDAAMMPQSGEVDRKILKQPGRRRQDVNAQRSNEPPPDDRTN